MARLYSKTGADAHADPEYGPFYPDSSGGFPFPDEVSDVLVTFAVKGKKLWESESERADRKGGEEMAQRRDPASLLTVMEENAALTRQLAAVMERLASIQVAQSAPAVPSHPTPADGDSGTQAVVPAASEGSPGEPAPAPKPARPPKPAAKGPAKPAATPGVPAA